MKGNNMAEETKAPAAKKPVKQQGKDGVYWLVNPAGAIHDVTKAHSIVRLRLPGWRLATEDEIKQLQGRELQRFDAPICEPWTPDPEAQLAALE